MAVGEIGCGHDGVHNLADAPPIAIDAPADATAPSPRIGIAAMISGPVTCGELAPTAIVVEITNTGELDLEISALDATGGFVIDPNVTFPITIAPTAMHTVAITPPVAVLGTDLAGMPKTGMLTVTTNEATATTMVPLLANVMGANLTFTDAGGASITPTFTDTTGACPAPQAVFIHNTGNLPITINYASANSFTSNFSSGTLAAGEMVQQIIKPYTLNNNACVVAETITYAVTGSLCNGDSSGASIGLAASLNVTGTSFCFCS